MAGVAFDAPNLAAQVEALSQDGIDRLPFGVVLLDPHFTVQYYNATESRLSGYGKPLGQNFFEISESPNKGELEARIRHAMEAGPVDLEFSWMGGKGASLRELRMRIQSASRGGVWMFIERD